MGRLYVVPAGRFLVAGLVLAAAAGVSILSNNSIAAEPAPHIRLQPSDTLTLSDLQDQFTAVADRVAPSVVAVSASITELGGDDLVQTSELSPQRLGRALDHATRSVGTGLII